MGDSRAMFTAGGPTIVAVQFVSDSREAEITYFQRAIRIHQNVGWLDVAVKNIGGVHVVHAAKQLIHEQLNVLIGDVLLTMQDASEVRLDKLKHEQHITQV